MASPVLSRAARAASRRTWASRRVFWNGSDEQRDVAKLGEFLLGGPLPRQEWQGFSEPLEPAFLGMLFAQPELDLGKPRGGLSPGRVVLEPLAAVQRGLRFDFVGFLQVRKPGVDPAASILRA